MPDGAGMADPETADPGTFAVSCRPGVPFCGPRAVRRGRRWTAVPPAHGRTSSSSGEASSQASTVTWMEGIEIHASASCSVTPVDVRLPVYAIQ